MMIVGTRVPGAPLVRRRGDVVPAAAVLVVGDDDGGVLPVGAVLHGLHQVGDVLLALLEVGVARVLVVRAERLDEGDGRQAVVLQRGEEVGLVLQVRGPARACRRRSWRSS